MKKIKFNKFYTLVFIIFIFSLSLIACKKEKTNNIQAPENNQTVTYPVYSDFYINTVSFNSAGHLVVIFSKELDKKQDFKTKFKLEPTVENLEIDSYGNKLVLKGNFTKETPYSINFNEDLSDIDGNKLGNFYPFSNLYIGKLKPSLSFSDTASTLPSLNNKRINFDSVNIKKVKLEIIKVYTNNITNYLKVKDYQYYKETFKEDLGDVVFTKEYVLENKTDEVMKNSIDLSGVIDTKGVYHINIYANSPENIDYDENKYGAIEYYEWFDGGRIYARAEKNIILSDLGLIANSNANKLEMKVIDLNTLETIPNVKLDFVNKKNQVLEEGYTVSNGEYKSKLNPDDVFYVIAKNNNEFNILYLNESLINYSNFNVGGLVESSDLRVFTYTDKGYYRPGDEISVSVIARNKNLNLEENHPFTYSFISPTGVEKLNSILVNKSKNGFYNFKIKSDINDETGAWNLKIKFGDTEINKPIFIEAKVPNKIAIDIDTEKTYTKDDINENGQLSVDISANYLTGIKASSSQTFYDLAFFQKNIESKNYKNYIFTNPTIDFSYNTNINGTLDADGKENLKINMPASAKKLNLDILINANVLDSSGRYSTESKNLKLINSENVIGLQKIAQKDNSISINYIVLNLLKDELVTGKKLKYRLFNKKYNWWYDNYENNENYIKNSLETIISDEGELLSSNIPQILELKKLEEGINFLEVEDMETGVSSGIFIYNFSYGDKAKNGMENLNISSDKEKYEIGDVARIKYNAAIDTKALITIEKDGKILKEYWKNLSQNNNEELITIEKEFFPNAYVNVSVFQKYKNKDNDRPLRLYGTVPLIVNDKTKELNIVIDSNPEAKPATDYKLKIYNKENKKMFFQYYLVDEGVLRQTDYKIPKPYEFFYGKQAKLVKNYDNFSNIIEKYSNKNIANYLTTGGGEYEALAMAKSAFSDENMNLQGKAERFKNISIVSEILETDENGFAEVDVKLPNYFGSMKIFVVAVSDDKFGSTEKTLTIKAPVIVEASAPRVLKVGDKFSIPVTLFPIEDNLGNAKLTIKYDGKELSKEINFPNKEAQKFFFDLTAPELVGETKIELSFESTKYSFKDTIDLNVDSPYPQQYISSTKVLKAGEEFKINGNEFKDFIASSLNAELNLSSYENLGLYKIIASLLDYPYICLEQTTSKGIAMLAITKLTNDENELNLAKNSLNTIIKKLFNNYQQSDGSFSYWPGTNGIDTYATSIYTTEFLVEARKQGYYVPDEMYNRALNYIKSLFNRTDIVTTSKVDALYVLAMTGEANISEMNIIFDKYYKNLPNFVKWVLLDTYNLIGEKDFAKNEANKLKIYSDDNLDSIYFNAKILKHYISIYGERSQELFKELLNVIKSDTWLSTYTQANIISALSKSIKNIERKNLSFVIDENGMKKDLILVNGQFNLKDINRIFKEHRNITIKNTSPDNLYLNFLVKGKPIKFTEKDESNNIVLKREFLDVNGAQVDPKNLKVGDRFTLVIQSELKNLDFIDNLALVQILPSGWELAPEFNNDSYFNYIDKRDDRIAFFYSQNKHETKEIRIDINVVTPGEYYLPGISVEAMYDNNIRAYLKGFNIKVNK